MTDPTSPLRPPEAAGLSDDTLEEVNRLWTVVRAFSNTAHDVNNALQVIAGSAELLEARDLDPAVRRRVETIRLESGKAAATINRLLAYARAQRQPAQNLDVWPLVESAVAMRLSSAGRKRIGLSIERVGASPVWISGDGAKVLQALVDLLLIAEDRVGERRNARIVVRVAAAASFARVEIVSGFDESGEPMEKPMSETRGVTAAAQLWAASHIAAAQGGSIVDENGTLTMNCCPAASPSR